MSERSVDTFRLPENSKFFFLNEQKYGRHFTDMLLNKKFK